MQTKNKIMLTVVNVLLLLCKVNAEIFSSEQELDIESFMDSVLSCRNIPGLTLSVVKEDETWARGFGLADVHSDIEVTNTTKFVIGSLGKAFTMTLLGIYLHEKGYSWKTKLADIPDLELEFVDDVITREATFADLLSHKTGLSDVVDLGFIAGFPDGTTKEFLARRIRNLPQQEEFRTSFLYNNLMYMLLGYVTELLGNGKWENLLSARLFEPLGMTSSSVLMSVADIAKEDVAQPYILPDKEFEDGDHNIYDISPLEPAGGIFSNAIDMAKWMRSNLQNGAWEGRQLISSDLLSQAFQEHIEMPFGGIMISKFPPFYPINDTTSGYGFAWFTSKYRGHERLWHSGGLFSYISLLWLFPKEKVGIFANINGPCLPSQTSDALKTVFYYISDILLGEDPWINSSTACTFPAPWVNFSIPVPPTKKPENLTSYPSLYVFNGTYGTELLPDVTVSVRAEGDDDEYLWFEMNRIKGRLLVTKEENKFSFQMEEPWEYAIEHRNDDRYFRLYPVVFHFKEGDVQAKSFELWYTRRVAVTFKRGVSFNSIYKVSSAAVLCQTLGILVILVHVYVVVIYNLTL